MYHSFLQLCGVFRWADYTQKTLRSDGEMAFWTSRQPGFWTSVPVNSEVYATGRVSKSTGRLLLLTQAVNRSPTVRPAYLSGTRVH